VVRGHLVERHRPNERRGLRQQGAPSQYPKHTLSRGRTGSADRVSTEGEQERTGATAASVGYGSDAQLGECCRESGFRPTGNNEPVTCLFASVGSLPSPGWCPTRRPLVTVSPLLALTRRLRRRGRRKGNTQCSGQGDLRADENQGLVRIVGSWDHRVQVSQSRSSLRRVT